jgi:hypothetical protein
MTNTLTPRIKEMLLRDGTVTFDEYTEIMRASDAPVDWAYDVWDSLLKLLQSKDGHRRSLSAQTLCNLAKSDPEQRMLRDFEKVFAITRDPKFVTARHTLQALWRVGVVSNAHRAQVVNRLAGRFADCAGEKNATLVRYEIMVNLFKIFEATNDEAVKQQALALIDTEADPQYRKKYAGVWRAASSKR